MNELKRQFILGTAGHIDHGKTALVMRLTGTDTDRLQEEKERGMTIDLGFAFMREDVTIIDVPGHERFIRNMVAGVSTIDFVIFVIAADDGVMPQTREHLEILNLLQIPGGIIVLTKIDIADPEWIELVEEDIAGLVKGTILEKAPVVKVSNETGQGINELKEIIFKEISRIGEKKNKGIFRLNIDRIFSMKGFGTVAAGSVISGELKENDEVELLPARKNLRIRGIQSHGKSVNKVRIGDRAAVNLVNINKKSIQRGHVLAAPGYFKPTRFFDSTFYLLKSVDGVLKNTTRVRIHIGTSEVIGRITTLDKNLIEPGQSAYAQFKLEKEVVADFDDRFVVCSYSPVYTIGGGKIIDPHPRKHKRMSPNTIETMKRLESGDTEHLVYGIVKKKSTMFFTESDIARELSVSHAEARDILKQLVAQRKLIEFHNNKQQLFILKPEYDNFKKDVVHQLKEYHKKYSAKRGMTLSELRLSFKQKLESFVLNNLIESLIQEDIIQKTDDKYHIKDYTPLISDEMKETMKSVESIFQQGFLAPPILDDVKKMINMSDAEIDQVMTILIEDKILIKIDDKIIVHIENLEHAMKLTAEFFKSKDEMTVGDCGQLFNISRKYSLPLLNYFDSLGFTVRQEGIRVLNTDYIHH